MDKTPKKLKGEVADELRSMFSAHDKDVAMRHKAEFSERYCEIAPKAAAFVDEEIEDCFAVYQLPCYQCKRVRTTNMLERYHSEVRRRTRVVRIFPNEQSLLRLVSSVAVDISDEWVSGRAYLNTQQDVDDAELKSNNKGGDTQNEKTKTA